MSENSGWGISWHAWEISPRFHKYGFVLLNKLRIVANTIFSNPKPVYYLKHFCSASFFTYLDSSDRAQNMIQLKQGYECLLHYDLSHRVIWHNAKTVMMFGTESFPTLYYELFRSNNFQLLLYIKGLYMTRSERFCFTHWLWVDVFCD